MERNIMKIRRYLLMAFLLAILCQLTACGDVKVLPESTPDMQVGYTTDSGGGYEISGYEADFLAWSKTPAGPQLYYVNPDFLLGDAFAEYSVEGGAEWVGEDRKTISFGFTSYPLRDETMTGVAWSFSVELEGNTVVSRTCTGQGQEELSPSDEAVIQMGQTLAEIMTAAEQYVDALEQ